MGDGVGDKLFELICLKVLVLFSELVNFKGLNSCFFVFDASCKPVSTFSSDNFAVSSGAVTIKDSGVSNDELAGSIANAKLANSSVTIGDSAISLGGTDTTLTGLTDLDMTAGNKTILDGNFYIK